MESRKRERPLREGERKKGPDPRRVGSLESKVFLVRIVGRDFKAGYLERCREQIKEVLLGVCNFFII